MANNGKLKRFVMEWSDEDAGWAVVYAKNQDEANVKFANGDYGIE